MPTTITSSAVRPAASSVSGQVRPQVDIAAGGDPRGHRTCVPGSRIQRCFLRLPRVCRRRSRRPSGDRLSLPDASRSPIFRRYSASRGMLLAAILAKSLFSASTMEPFRVLRYRIAGLGVQAGDVHVPLPINHINVVERAPRQGGTAIPGRCRDLRPGSLVYPFATSPTRFPPAMFVADELRGLTLSPGRP